MLTFDVKGCVRQKVVHRHREETFPPRKVHDGGVLLVQFIASHDTVTLCLLPSTHYPQKFLGTAFSHIQGKGHD
jgi:hypothetical protein